jgi:hypothetical protein
MSKKDKRQDLIPHEYNGFKFYQRASDGYCDANAMCVANGKRFDNYLANKNTKVFMRTLKNKLPDFSGSLLDAVEGRNGGTLFNVKRCDEDGKSNILFII